MCLKSSMNPIRKQTKQKIQKIFFIVFQNSCHPLQHTWQYLVQLPETISKGLLWNWSQNGCHTIFDGIHVRKTCTFDSRLQARKQEGVYRSQIWESKEGDQAQLPSSEPGIGAHGLHCVQWHYCGTASIFQSCANLAEPARYAVALGSKIAW